MRPVEALVLCLGVVTPALLGPSREVDAKGEGGVTDGDIGDRRVLLQRRAEAADRGRRRGEHRREVGDEEEAP